MQHRQNKNFYLLCHIITHTLTVVLARKRMPRVHDVQLFGTRSDLRDDMKSQVKFQEPD